MSARISIIAAVARNRVIGRSGQLPWRLRSDLRAFRRLTLGKPVIMGRATLESIGKPLDGRDNVVVSRRPGLRIDGATVVDSVAAALREARCCATARGIDEIMVIGGAEIYAALLPAADRLYLTEVDASPAGDALFPEIDPAEWREARREPLARGEGDDHDAELVVLDRVGGADRSAKAGPGP